MTWDTKPGIKTLNVSREEINIDVITDNNVETGGSAQLIVHNDEINTFQWVIMTFIDLLNHSSAQAEQCALIIHTKGKCQVKSGLYEDMLILKEGLIDRKLSATVEL